MRPQFFQVIGTDLVVVWDDVHESYYPVEQLRRSCPCAGCSGEPDLFGRIARGPEVQYTPKSFDIIDLELIGNYGLQIKWADDHGWGIWTFDKLRTECGCDACRARRAGG